MAGLRRINKVAERSSIATSAVGGAFHTETGIGTLPLTTNHRVFTTAFGSRPLITVDIPGTIGEGKGVSFDIVSIRAGSFGWRGTPSVRARFTAQGIRS